MLPIRGLYEVAIRVKDLPRAEVFYREILGLQVGIRDDRRNWLFLRAGGEAGMIVLQEDKGEWPLQHRAGSRCGVIERFAKLPLAITGGSITWSRGMVESALRTLFCLCHWNRVVQGARAFPA